MGVVKWEVLITTRVMNATVIAFSAEEYQDEEDFAPATFGVRYVLSNFVRVSFVIPFCRATSSNFVLGNQALVFDILIFYEEHSVKFFAPKLWDMLTGQSRTANT